MPENDEFYKVVRMVEDEDSVLHPAASVPFVLCDVAPSEREKVFGIMAAQALHALDNKLNG